MPVLNEWGLSYPQSPNWFWPSYRDWWPQKSPGSRKWEWEEIKNYMARH